MKQINFDKIRERNAYEIDQYLGGMKMEFIKNGNNYIIKNSGGRVVSEKEKLQLEKQELVIKDVESSNCQQETTKKIKKINKKIKEADKKPIKENKDIADTIEETSKPL